MSRTIILGLDAFHTDLLEFTPNIKKLYNRNLSGSLESTEPPVTAPAWASFQTGSNQGKHGIYDFVSYDEDFEMEFLDGTDLRAKAFYEYLDEQGQDCLLFNLPFSLPARIEGDIVPSWLDSNDAEPVPSDLYEQYEISPPQYPEQKGSPLEKIASIRSSFHHNSKQFFKLLKSGDHDFLFQLISATDWVQHHGYRAVRTSPESDVAKATRTLFKEVDEYVADIESSLSNDDTLILLSDHGFELFDGIFYMNDWLESQGYLKTGETPISSKEQEGQRTIDLGNFGRILAKQEWLYPILRRAKYSADRLFDIDVGYEAGINFEESTAYCLSKDECAVRIDRHLPDTKRTKIADMILQGLAREDGVTASRGSDVYQGPYADESGDVIVHSEAYRASRGPVGRIRTRESVAYHSKEGFFTAIEQKDNHLDVDDTKLIDIAPTILALSGIPIPKKMDGDPITELVDSAEFQDYPEYEPKFLLEKDAGKADVEERLSDLGYL